MSLIQISMWDISSSADEEYILSFTISCSGGDISDEGEINGNCKSVASAREGGKGFTCDDKLKGDKEGGEKVVGSDPSEGFMKKLPEYILVALGSQVFLISTFEEAWAILGEERRLRLLIEFSLILLLTSTFILWRGKWPLRL